MCTNCFITCSCLAPLAADEYNNRPQNTYTAASATRTHRASHLRPAPSPTDCRFNIFVTLMLYGTASKRLFRRRELIMASIELLSTTTANLLGLHAHTTAMADTADAVALGLMLVPQQPQQQQQQQQAAAASARASAQPPPMAAVTTSRETAAALLQIASTWRSVLHSERGIIRSHLDTHSPIAPLGWWGFLLQGVSAIAAVIGLLAHVGLIDSPAAA